MGKGLMGTANYQLMMQMGKQHAEVQPSAVGHDADWLRCPSGQATLAN
jgi:hypothetical protein